MRQRTYRPWIPFWVDKWLSGSTRLELEPAERSVWIDLLALAAKDEGHIRANQGVPYLERQLAGLLVVPEELLRITIEKCLSEKVNKLRRETDGTYFVINWDKYQLSERQQRNVMKKIADLGEDKIKEEFERLWLSWPRDRRFKKQYCFGRFHALCQRGELEEFRAAVRSYVDLIKIKKVKENFDQAILHIATFLNNWKDYQRFKYEPPL
jgi:hypothetical protein